MTRATLLLACALCAACSEDETAPIDIGPTGNPTLRFADPESGTIGCRSVGDDADTQVPLLVEVNQLILRPPGACQNLRQCGHLALFAEGVLNNESSVPAIDLLIYKLADPFHTGDDHAATGEPDLLTVEVEVVDDAGRLINDHDGEPLHDEISLRTVTNCPGPN